MTRAEAIEILKILKLHQSNKEEKILHGKALPIIEALDMAIASLETDEAYQLEYEQPEFCADCISRAEVLKLMKDNWHTHNGDWAMQESMDDIRALPSVTPQEPINDIISKLLDKTFDDFCECPGGEGWFYIDGEKYGTDAGYALEGMEIFIKVLKKRLAKSEEGE